MTVTQPAPSGEQAPTNPINAEDTTVPGVSSLSVPLYHTTIGDPKSLTRDSQVVPTAIPTTPTEAEYPTTLGDPKPFTEIREAVPPTPAPSDSVSEPSANPAEPEQESSPAPTPEEPTFDKEKHIHWGGRKHEQKYRGVFGLFNRGWKEWNQHLEFLVQGFHHHRRRRLHRCIMVSGPKVRPPVYGGRGKSGFWKREDEVEYVEDNTWVGVRKSAAGVSELKITGDGANALVDSGTTQSYVKPVMLRALIGELEPNATRVRSPQGNLYKVSCDLENSSNYLTFNFNNQAKIDIPLANFIVHTEHQGENICVLGIIESSGTVLGASFLQLAYAVFDLDAKTISFAQAVNTDAENIEVLPAL